MNGGPEENSDFFDNVIQRVDINGLKSLCPGSLRSSDILDTWHQDGVKPVDLMPYTYPSKSEIESKNIVGIFLGHYLPWDGHKSSCNSKWISNL